MDPKEFLASADSGQRRWGEPFGGREDVCAWVREVMRAYAADRDTYTHVTQKSIYRHVAEQMGYEGSWSSFRASMESIEPEIFAEHFRRSWAR